MCKRKSVRTFAKSDLNEDGKANSEETKEEVSKNEENNDKEEVKEEEKQSDDEAELSDAKLNVEILTVDEKDRVVSKETLYDDDEEEQEAASKLNGSDDAQKDFRGIEEKSSTASKQDDDPVTKVLKMPSTVVTSVKLEMEERGKKQTTKPSVKSGGPKDGDEEEDEDDDGYSEEEEDWEWDYGEQWEEGGVGEKVCSIIHFFLCFTVHELRVKLHLTGF